ncbi:MAG: pyridoxal phosphate-dependent aminotransferase [Saprospiraceae bacterium]|nr:pyridoxal phosphate-dependent aminotransferase [Saprospiraceae bacterium]
MPGPSKRGFEIDASPIRSLLPYAREAIRQGVRVYHLNIGQPDLETPEPARKLLQNLEEPIVRYGPSEGFPSLRKAVAKYYARFETNVSSEDVFVTTGASEAILFTLLSCCNQGDELIIPEPFYANYIGYADVSDVKIVPITTSLENGFQLPSPEKFEEKINSKTKAIFLCNPGNPTGQLYEKEQLESLLRIVKKHNLFLIVDEVYREFCYDSSFTSVLSFSGMEEHVIVIDSISKVFSACGARVGFLITKNKSVQEAVNKYAQLRLCPPYYGQNLALACYEDPIPYISKAKEKYQSRRKVLFDGLSNIDGVECYLPAAAFYNIVELPVPDAEAFCKWLLTDFRYQNETVMLAPANGFYFNKEYGKSQVRIAYILNEDDLRKAIHCLDLGLAEFKKEVLSVASR